MQNFEVMDLTQISQNFPSVPVPEINRDHFLDTIENMLEGGVQAVAIEGTEGIGKTTLLGKFAQRHPRSSISIFIKPGNRWLSDPGTLKLNLCNQLKWVLQGVELLEAIWQILCKLPEAGKH
jgi:ABC-type phosphate/phosphonate transport system ATPase subunit